MANLQVKLNRSGVRELLQSEEMKAICKELADGISSRAGDGFEISTFTGKNRVNASVHAQTDEALSRCLEDNVLLKALR